MKGRRDEWDTVDCGKTASIFVEICRPQGFESRYADPDALVVGAAEADVTAMRDDVEPVPYLPACWRCPLAATRNYYELL